MAERPPTGRFHWLTKHIPTKETVHKHRLLRPFARRLTHNSLWRFNRRSVPRGVALGLFVGVMIPVLHTAIAAVLAIPARANVAVAAVFTLVVNPFTIPAVYYLAYRLGAWELHQDAHLTNTAAAERISSEIGRILFWIHQASGPIAVGVLTLAILAAAIGYFGSAFIWRLRAGSRYRRRRLKRQAR